VSWFLLLPLASVIVAAAVLAALSARVQAELDRLAPMTERLGALRAALSALEVERVRPPGPADAGADSWAGAPRQ
jgi:hypothetical protein